MSAFGVSICHITQRLRTFALFLLAATKIVLPNGAAFLNAVMSEELMFECADADFVCICICAYL